MADRNAPYYPNEGTLLDQGYVLRNMAAGVAQVPRMAGSLAGMLGWDAAGAWSNRFGEQVNSALGTRDAVWNQDPGAFISQNAGAALVGLPAGAFGWLARFAPTTRAGQAALRVAEAATPLTLPLRPGNVVANAVGGTVGGGVLQAAEQALRTETWDDLPTEPPAAQDDFVDIATEPQPVAQPAAAEDFVDIPTEQRPLGDRVADWLPLGALIGVGALAARQAYRQGMRRIENSDALRDTTVAPGTPTDPTIVQPSAVQEAARQFVDEGAVARSFIDNEAAAGNIPPERADQLRSFVDVYAGVVARTEQAAALNNTGVLPSGLRVGRPLRAIAEEAAAMPPEQLARVQDYLAVQNELANRVRAAELWQNTRDSAYLATERDADGRHLYADVPIFDSDGNMRPLRMEEPARVGLWDQSFNDLMRRQAELRTDPAVMQVAEEFRSRAERFRRALVQEGYMSQADANRMARANPYYLPTLDMDAGPARHFTFREIGQHTQPAKGQDALQAWADYESQFVHVTQHNRAKREVAQFLREMQDRMPADKRVVGRILPADVAQGDGITFRDQGKKYKLEVFTPGLVPVMQNHPRFVMPWFNGMRRAFQNFTTGPGAALVGAPFAVTSAGYNTFSTLATRPRGVYAGLLDKLAQQLTGGPGFRGDPTFVAQTFIAPMQDLASLAARELSLRMRNSRYAPLAHYLSRAYERSVHAEMQRYGATSSGISATADFATQMDTALRHVSPGYDATRGVDLGTPRTLADLQRYAHTFGVTALPKQAVEAWHLWKEVIDIVANAPQSALWRQNRERAMQRAEQAGLSARAGLEGLSRTVRQAGADPSISGANPGVTGLASTVPYMNVAIQSLAVYGKALRTNPVGTLTAVGMMTVVPALISAYTAMLYDEQRIANGEEPIAVRDRMLGSSNQQAGNTRVYLPGLPIEASFALTHDPTVAPVATAVNMMVNALLGLDDPSYFYSDGNTPQREMLRRLINDHSWRTMVESAGRAGAQFAPPPLLDLAMRGLGVDMREAFNLADARVGDLRRRNAPGYEEGATFDDPVAPRWRHVLEAMFGTAGTAFVQHMRLMSVLSRSNAPTVDQLAAHWGLTEQRTADRMPQAAPLFSGPRRRDSFDTVAEFVRDAENKISNVVAGFGDVRAPGTIGSGNTTRVPEYGPGRQRPPADIVPLLVQVNGLSSQLRALQQRRTVIQQEVVSAQSVVRGQPAGIGQYSLLADPARMRTFQNTQNDHIRDINEQIAQRIIDFEQRMSQQLGVQVRLNELDPTQGLAQFARR